MQRMLSTDAEYRTNKRYPRIISIYTNSIHDVFTAMTAFAEFPGTEGTHPTGREQ
jgi:hypothetical protein